MKIKQKVCRWKTIVTCLYLFNLFDVLHEYKNISLKNNLKFFIMFGFVSLTYSTPVRAKFKSERLFNHLYKTDGSLHIFLLLIITKICVKLHKLTNGLLMWAVYHECQIQYNSSNWHRKDSVQPANDSLEWKT